MTVNSLGMDEEVVALYPAGWLIVSLLESDAVVTIQREELIKAIERCELVSRRTALSRIRALVEAGYLFPETKDTYRIVTRAR